MSKSLRILVVEDDPELLPLIVKALSNKKGKFYKSVFNSEDNIFDEIFVTSAKTTSLARDYIQQYPEFNLFILDNVVHLDDSKTNDSGLSLIPFAISVNRKPKAVVSFSGENPDLGQDEIKPYFPSKNYSFLFKKGKPEENVENLIKHLTTLCVVNEQQMPRVLSLCVNQGDVTIICNGFDSNSVPSICLHYSEDNEDCLIPITHKRSCLFLHYLGWEGKRFITNSKIAEILDIHSSRDDFSIEISEIRKAIIKSFSKYSNSAPYNDKSFIKKYIFTTGVKKGFRLLDNVKIQNNF